MLTYHYIVARSNGQTEMNNLSAADLRIIYDALTTEFRRIDAQGNVMANGAILFRIAVLQAMALNAITASKGGK